MLRHTYVIGRMEPDAKRAPARVGTWLRQANKMSDTDIHIGIYIYRHI